MYKTYKSFLATVVVVLLLATCTTKDENGVYFAANVDLTNSSLVGQRLKVILKFSTDNGATFVNGVNLAVGTKFQARLWNTQYDVPIGSTTGIAVDWSGSTPAPSSASSDTPEFVITGGANTIVAKVTGTFFCAFDQASFLGDWKANEGVGKTPGGASFNGSIDPITLTQDPSNPNKIWATNMFGDGADQIWYMNFNPSTSKDTQTITVPAQTTDEGCDLLAATGTYDQCAGTLTVGPVSYCGYVWTYSFSR